MTTKAPRMKAGDVRRFDFQADVYERRYELVARVPGKPKTWLCRLLPLEPEKVAAMRTDPYYGDAEVARAEARTGDTLEMRFVTAAEYARYF